MQEKSLNEMSNEELRQGLAEYERQIRGVPAAPPLPPGITADMTPKAQEAAAEAHTALILAKPAGAWTPAEKEFIRGSLGPALKAMGY